MAVDYSLLIRIISKSKLAKRLFCYYHGDIATVSS